MTSTNLIANVPSQDVAQQRDSSSRSLVALVDSECCGQFQAQKASVRKNWRITLSIAALCLAALVNTAPSAKAYDFCVLDDPWRGMDCVFDTIEECRASASGRGGSCGRAPSLNSAANAYAYAPSAFNAKVRKQIKK